MTSISNLFSNFDDLTKNKSIIDNSTIYKNNILDTSIPTPALNQGNKFKKYQSKIKHKIEKNIDKVNSKEGFDGLTNSNSDSLTTQSNNIIDKTNFSSQTQTIKNLRQQYEDTLEQYKKIIEKIKARSTQYLNRVNPSNPYINKNIKFTDGTICYVTNHGVAKPYSSFELYQTTAGFNGCPTQSQIVQLDIPFSSSYVVGSTIPTNPALVMGTPMINGQSCGNEGVNVYVNTLMNQNPTSTYKGCYKDDINSPTMTIIGGSPSPSIEIQNGNLVLRTEILSHDGGEIFETNSSGKAELKDAIELGTAAAKKVKKEATELLQACLNPL